MHVAVGIGSAGGLPQARWTSCVDTFSPERSISIDGSNRPMAGALGRAVTRMIRSVTSLSTSRVQVLVQRLKVLSRTRTSCGHFSVIAMAHTSAPDVHHTLTQTSLALKLLLEAHAGGHFQKDALGAHPFERAHNPKSHALLTPPALPLGNTIKVQSSPTHTLPQTSAFIPLSHSSLPHPSSVSHRFLPATLPCRRPGPVERRVGCSGPCSSCLIYPSRFGIPQTTRLFAPPDLIPASHSSPTFRASSIRSSAPILNPTFRASSPHCIMKS